MMRLIQSVFLMALICNLSGCLFQDTGVRARLENGSTSPVVIPEHMDKPVLWTCLSQYRERSSNRIQKDLQSL